MKCSFGIINFLEEISSLSYSIAFEPWCWRRLLRVPWTARRCNQSILKESVLNIHWKDWCWSWNANALATWCEEPTHWKRPWCWKRWKAGGKGDDRGWDGLMASSTRWTWVWGGSGSWWWSGKPGMLQSMGSQRVRHDRATELNWTEPDPETLTQVKTPPRVPPLWGACLLILPILLRSHLWFSYHNCPSHNHPPGFSPWTYL